MPTGAASTLIKLATDRVDNSLNLRKFLLERLCRDSLALGLDPLGGLLGERQQCLAAFVIDLTTESFLVADLCLETIDKGECIDSLSASMHLHATSSSAAKSSASQIIQPISSFERRAFSLVVMIDSDLPLWMMIEHKITTKTVDDSRSLVGSRYLHNTIRG